MENSKQQAIAANESAIAQHQEAIQLAKQATWEIIAKQKAEAQAASQIIQQAIQEQRATAQQTEEITHSSSKESQESVSPRQADAMEEGKTEDAPLPEEETAVWQILMPPSLEETITQLHSDAAQVHQQMQADILQTMPQQFKTEIDAS
ncbi:MAG: hypothetical protein QNJ55_33265 [Xenococcus sp. MO_188.B8]|nr:hypothetical protein [Xenococcus sp. MO_188.B8]